MTDSWQPVRWCAVLLMAAVVHLGGAAVAQAQLGALMSPGRLHKTHASLEGVSNCLQCHSQGQQVTAAKCLTCHQPIATRMAAKRGVHRAVTTDCVTCHVEHAGADAELRPFDLKAFDHARDAGYPLTGLHAPVAANCAACHKVRSYLTAQTACASCHADPHKGSLGPQCSTCHSTAVAFAAATKGFDHTKTKFPLAGAHGKVACESCHKNKQYKGIAFASCSSCHADPHKAKLGTACASCHTETAWRTAKVDHARTAFPLRAKHAAVECAKCHVKPAALVKPRSDTCAACHTDPHRGVFKQDCGACHTESSFQKGTFDHGVTKFALADKHTGLACVACHKTARPAANDFRGLKTSCDSCHADVHRAELGLSCEKCHSAKTFAVPAFTHAVPRPFFAGQHARLTCAECHVSTMQPTRTAAGVPALRIGYATTPTACVSCHKDVHLGQLKASCETCHTLESPKFAIPGFSHAGTRFPLIGKHLPLACEKCHKTETGAFPAGPGSTRRFTGVGTTCVSCHEDVHRGQLDQACQACHSSDTFALPGYAHKNARGLRQFFTGRHATATCASCHKPLPATPAPAKPVAAYKVSTTCITCHTDVHRGALGAACETCHKP